MLSKFSTNLSFVENKFKFDNNWTCTLRKDIFDTENSCNNITWSAVLTRGYIIFSIQQKYFDCVALRVHSIHAWYR